MALMSPIKKLFCLYMFVSQHQPLQIAGNKLFNVLILSRNYYYFAINITPIFDWYPSCDDLNSILFKYK